MRRPQFTLKTLLWLMVVVGAFFGGRAVGIRDEQKRAANELEQAAREVEELWAKLSPRLRITKRNLNAEYEFEQLLRKWRDAEGDR